MKKFMKDPPVFTDKKQQANQGGLFKARKRVSANRKE
jgi:hypothetical protein